MAVNITSVTVTFGNGIKRDEYGPVKKAEVSFTAAVADDEDGTVVAAFLSHVALARVAEMLSAPKPETVPATAVALARVEEPASVGEPSTPPARRTRRTKAEMEEAKAATEATETSPEPTPGPTPTEEVELVQDEWEVGAEDITITDQEILSATSKRAGELGAREPIVKLIATFATRTEGAPFKVQEIPQAQRKDYLTKLAALTT